MQSAAQTDFENRDRHAGRQVRENTFPAVAVVFKHFNADRIQAENHIRDICAWSNGVAVGQVRRWWAYHCSYYCQQHATGWSAASKSATAPFKSHDSLHWNPQLHPEELWRKKKIGFWHSCMCCVCVWERERVRVHIPLKLTKPLPQEIPNTCDTCTRITWAAWNKRRYSEFNCSVAGRLMVHILKTSYTSSIRACTYERRLANSLPTIQRNTLRGTLSTPSIRMF